MTVDGARSTSSAKWVAFYVARDARAGVARNPLAALAIILIIGFASCVAGGVWLAQRGTSSLAGLLEQQASFRVFLQPGTQMNAAASAVASLSGVRSVRQVSRQETLHQMSLAFSGRVDLQRAFADNPFRDSLVVSVTRAQAIPSLVASIKKLPGVDEVVDAQSVVAPLLGLATTLRTAGNAAVVGIGVVALLVGGVTWRLALLSRLAEVRIKRLMGVKERSILAQFTLEGALLGLMGGILAALALVYAVSSAVAHVLVLLPFTHSAPAYAVLVWGSLGVGVVLGAGGSTWAAQRVLWGLR